MRGDGGLPHMSMKLGGQVLRGAIAGLLHGQLHHPASVCITRPWPNHSRDLRHGQGQPVVGLQLLAKSIAALFGEHGTIFCIRAGGFLNHAWYLWLCSACVLHAPASANLTASLLILHGRSKLTSADHVGVRGIAIAVEIRHGPHLRGAWRLSRPGDSVVLIVNGHGACLWLHERPGCIHDDGHQHCHIRLSECLRDRLRLAACEGLVGLCNGHDFTRHARG
mmetsp:Transcript_74637/g.178022  ORF Transcript_74637/g.178022 Transcript_74637/m.178022 type:complete len:222 (-) Transcript_74637:72-737(-)